MIGRVQSKSEAYIGDANQNQMYEKIEPKRKIIQKYAQDRDPSENVMAHSAGKNENDRVAHNQNVEEQKCCENSGIKTGTIRKSSEWKRKNEQRRITPAYEEIM